MENKFYEIIKPVRSLEKHKSNKFKKGLIALGIVMAFFSFVGVVANANGYINLPLMINKSIINPMPIYSWNHSIPVPTLLNQNLINPSFNAGGFKLGYN